MGSGALEQLLKMLEHGASEAPLMQSAAAACICNLAANPASKVTIAQVRRVCVWARARVKGARATPPPLHESNLAVQKVHESNLVAQK